ncbi:MAG: biotin--[acetyl-CoA-carboxylase] ligase [Leptospiraceae bacterium]|nr:biotin--[acetyl-CoA-carboxylase] ligase [Leptospiraceae bacterium]MCK6381079.1 biotin--[acetyl-CoA-carboxylase] ligase [Leptospiraceae bacterium]NUM42306.1 biotin--[acetyl-CoA-carboxylase] ligase [Leptospiraceae bacterium]
MPITLLYIDKGIYLESVDSTNTYLKKEEFQPGVWVSSKEQINGRGRKEKVWNSYGEDKIFFSGKIEFTDTRFPASVLSLFVGSEIFKVLTKIFPTLSNELKIKWPNDIYKKDKKIAGILIECEQKGNSLIVIVGIGINIFGTEIFPDSQNIGFLLDSKPKTTLMKNLTENLVSSVNQAALIALEKERIEKELEFVYSNSYLKEKIIKAYIGERQILGKSIGFTTDGFLIVETKTGEKFELLDTGPGFEVIGNE